ncbi:hypothetical protein O3P69_013746 [Scylla paramamosain]|uniref:Uncharacterized protein n=1 Tax=Scylla paramamosain TaxID=85552 RepID=A0AAW0SRE0_SCYPA
MVVRNWDHLTTVTVAMDDIQNAINEGRQGGESGENVWLPSAPQLSPEKTPEEAPAQSPRGDETTTEALEQKSTTEQKILISRFTVNRTPVSFPAGDAKEVTSHTPLTVEDHEVMEGKGTLASPHATPGTTTVTNTISAPPTTPTTPTTTASQATNTEDGEKTLGVAGTQTVDMEHQTGEKAATTVALLQEVVKELKTMLPLSPSKENRKCSPLVKLRLHKYCAFCCLAVVFLCLFGFCMWMLSTLSFDVARQHENLDPNSIDTLEWLEQQQIREKSGILSKEEVSGLAAKVPGNAEIEESSDSQEMQKPSLSTEGTDTDEVVELVGEDKLETKAVESMEDKLMEEDTEDTSLRPGGIEHQQLEDMDSHTLDGEETRNAVDIRPKILGFWE